MVETSERVQPDSKVAAIAKPWAMKGARRELGMLGLTLVKAVEAIHKGGSCAQAA